MIKLIATDIDGTLVAGTRVISKRNTKAIKAALNQGIHFAIASGRSYQDIMPLLDNTGLACQIIAGNGSEYYDEQGNLLASCYLDKESCIKVCKIFEENGLNYFIHTSKVAVTTMPIDQVKKSFIKRMVAGTNQSFEKAYADMEANYIPMQNLTLVEDLDACFTPDIDILKVEGFDEFDDLINEVKHLIQDIESISYLSSFPNNIEVTNVNAQKGNILLQACKTMDIDPSEVLVLGDGENDLSMFELFPNSVAVANSVEMIKSLAKYHVADAKDDGVAEAIEKYALR